MKREEMIEKLIDNDFEDIQQDFAFYSGKSHFLHDILSDGWTGYSQMSEDELKKEYSNRFSE